MSRLSRKHQAAIKKAADGQGGGKKRTVRTPAGARRYGTPVDPPIPTGAGEKTASQSPSDRSSQSATEARSSKAAKARQDRREMKTPSSGAKSSTSSRRPTSVAGWEKLLKQERGITAQERLQEEYFQWRYHTPQGQKADEAHVAKVRAKAAASTVDKRREELDLRRRRAEREVLRDISEARGSS